MRSALIAMEPHPATTPAAATDDAAALREFCAHGDREALGALFARHAAPCYRLAQRLLDNSSDAEDAVQTAFLRVLKSAPEFQGRSSVRAWIMGYVVNCCREKRRTESRIDDRTARAALEFSADESAEGSDPELIRAMLHAARELPDHYRVPIWLHFFEGLSPAEVGVVLKSPDDTVRKQIARGVEKIRSSLASSGHSVSAAALPAIAAAIPQQAAPPALTLALTKLAAGGAVGASGAAAGSAGTAAKAGVLTKIIAATLAVGALTTGAVVIHQNSNSAAPPRPVIQPNETKGDGNSPASAASRPSAQLTGWRGDGTGQYPDATPPQEWGRWVKTPLRDLRCQARKPKSDAAGGVTALAPDGHIFHEFFIREWLVAGPFAAADIKTAMETEFVPKEADLQPDENDKAGDKAWKIQPGTGNHVNFDAKESNQVYYAHAYLYSNGAASTGIVFTHDFGAKIWFNGKVLYSHPEDYTLRNKGFRQFDIALAKGWNRILVKVSQAEAKRNDNGGWFDLALRPWGGSIGYDTKNIKWISRMPHNRSISQPVVTGDKILMTSEPDELICMNKADGKILWIRTNNYYDALGDNERKTLNIQDKADPIAAKLKQVNVDITKAVNAAANPLEPVARESFTAKAAERDGLSNALYELLKAADKRYDRRNDGSDFGFSLPSVCSDGQNVYVWFTTGVAACYDLDGNRKWSTIENRNWRIEHGNCASTLLVDGKMIVLMADIVALDMKTGAIAWQHKPSQNFHGTFVRARIGEKNVIVLPGDGALLDPDTGNALWISPGNAYFYSENSCSSPTVDKNTICQAPAFGKWLNCITLPEKFGNPLTPQYVKFEDKEDKAEHFTTASPIVFDSLVYTVDVMGLYRVWDPASKSVVCRQRLNLDIAYSYVNTPGASASLVLASKHIYVLDNQGTTVVLEPGRQYKQLSKNLLENITNPRQWGEGQEQTLTNPIFDGNCIYIRGMDNLYCIAETRK